MGVFDSVRIDYPLPEEFSFLQEQFFQTKDLYITAEWYIISKYGRLLHQRKWDTHDECWHGDIKVSCNYNLPSGDLDIYYFIVKFRHGQVVDFVLKEKLHFNTNRKKEFATNRDTE